MLWLFLLGLGFVTQSRIDAGIFGIVGFPIIAGVYAAIRRSDDANPEGSEEFVMTREMADFLLSQPNFLDAGHVVRNSAFKEWIAAQRKESKSEQDVTSKA
jgi:hypothetical protein